MWAFTPTNNQSILYDHGCESVKLLPITVGGQKIGPCVKNPGTSPGNNDPIVPNVPT